MKQKNLMSRFRNTISSKVEKIIERLKWEVRGWTPTYLYIVLPSNGLRLWLTTSREPINPPVKRRALGRPKKKRNKANDEATSSNVLPMNLTTVKRKSCGNFGHNLRTYKGKTTVDRQFPKGNNKTKKQKKTSTKEAHTVLTQGSQAPKTQETTRLDM